jgi:alkanesulfonate monooxygenase SsuD/methylene tetrahydromethanopterin reductase-like flavin-dependent oxidoreductase (luciferase family)
MVAQYADESNLICDVDELPRKLDALAAHCEALGRDRNELTVSWQRSVCIAPTMEEARADVDEFAARLGVSDRQREMMTGRFLVGDPDTIGEQLAKDLTAGIDGFTINLVVNGHKPGRVALLGETAAKVVFG